MNRPQALGSSCLSRLLICALLVLPMGAADAGASREPIQISGVRAELADTMQPYTKKPRRIGVGAPTGYCTGSPWRKRAIMNCNFLPARA